MHANRNAAQMILGQGQISRGQLLIRKSAARYADRAHLLQCRCLCGMIEGTLPAQPAVLFSVVSPRDYLREQTCALDLQINLSPRFSV